MSGSFTVGALAVAVREANAVGAVRLTLLPRRLEIELLRAGSFSDGYVPGGLTRFVRFSVPYSAVRGLVRRARGLMLSLDPAVATPYSRFYLTHFTDLPLEAIAVMHRRRSVARGFAWLLPLPLAVWIATRIPADLVSGTVGRASAGAVLALALAVALRSVSTWIEVGGPLSRRLRDALERKLAQRMGFEPASFHETDPFDLPELDRVEERPFEGPPRVWDEPIVLEPPPVEARPREIAPPPAPPVARLAPLPAPARREVPKATPIERPAPVEKRAGAAAGTFPPPPQLPPRAVIPVRQRPEPPPLPPPASAASAAVPSRRLGPTGKRVLTAGLAAAAVLAGLVGYRAVSAMRPAAKTATTSDAARGEAPADEAVAVAAPVVSNDAPPALPAEPAVTARAEEPRPAGCTCAHADSPLWRTGLPALTMIPIPKGRGDKLDSIAPVADEKGVSRYAFDVAVVNNANVPLKDVKIVITFARRNERGERVGATDRGLFWEGELMPARSVKWSVKGPGTELKIEMGERRMLGELPVAPADGFAKLLRARQPAVRLHASMMLAYLGDPRAKEAALALPAMSPTDEATRAKILRASGPLFVCDARYDKGDLAACVFNASDAPVVDPSIGEATEGDPLRKTPLTVTIPPHTGAPVTVAGFGPEAEELIAF